MGYQKKPCNCNSCGKPIKFIRIKGGKAIPVEPSAEYFLPDPNGKPFIMANGQQNTGVSASDGIMGYQRHVCVSQQFKPRQWTEKELAKRRWA